MATQAMKVDASAHLFDDAIVAAIEERRRAVEARIEELEEIEVEIARDENEFLRYLAHRRGLELKKARLWWADETLRIVARRRLSRIA